MQQMPPARVSLHMKRFAIVVAFAAIAGALWYLQRPAPSTASNTSPPPPTSRAQPITKVTKLDSKEQRAKLAEKIANARAARAAASATGATSSGRTGATSAAKPPSLPSGSPDTDTLKVEIRTAMREVIPIISQCYEAAIPTLASPNIKIVSELTLTGDPDIGTLIDAKQIADEAGQPLPATFDDCLRTTFQSLALPPLAEGDVVEVRYPFVFSTK